MIFLALDTSDSRGSLAVVADSTPRALRLLPPGEGYSTWLLPAAESALAEAALGPAQLDAYAVALGPGSFTGLRIGLTTVKAWAEVFRKPIVGVSRLLALASQAKGVAPFVAAYTDAHRGQLFAALYQRGSGGLVRIEEEMVTSPAEFREFVVARAGQGRVDWISLDPALAEIAGVAAASPSLAVDIARLALVAARENRFIDPLALDAAYVRRSDAEALWNSGAMGAAGPR